MSAVTELVRPNHAAWLGRGTWQRRIAADAARVLSERTVRVVAPVSLCGAVVLTLALSHGVDMLASPVIGLLVAAALAEAFPVPIEGVAAGATSFANVFIVAAATLYGWRAAAVIGALTMLAVEVCRRQRPVRLAFNSSLYVLAGAAAGQVAVVTPERIRNGLGGEFVFYVINIA